jgi:hypothetical protein
MARGQEPRIGQRIEPQFFGLLNAYAARPGFDKLADALPHRNHRVYISGNGISLVSSWISAGYLPYRFAWSQTDGRHS